MIAAWLRWADRADEVWLLPTHTHAFGKRLAPFEERVRWCVALAEAVGPHVSVCTVEASLPGTSYTRRTLDVLSEQHPDCAFRLVIGADLLPTTPRWRDWEGIEAHYAPLVVGRAGHPPVADAPTFPDVSSTAIREAFAQGRPVDHLVPAAVLALLDETSVTGRPVVP